MLEYIARDAARPDAFCIGVSCQDCPFLKSPLYGGCRIDDFIASIPAADVRSVVLCKDCVYSNKWYADRLICYLWNEHDGNSVFDDGFCNYGEKREES